MTTEQKEWIEAYSPETEATVLACMLNSEEQLAIAKASLTSEDFFIPKNRKIFRAILDAHDRSGAVDLPSLIAFWKDTQDIHPDEYETLIDLNNMSERYHNIELHCQTLQEFTIKRGLVKVIQEGTHYLKEGVSPSVSLQRLIDLANSIKERQKHGESLYRHLLVPTSEKAIIEEMKNTSPGARVGMMLDKVDLKIPGGALSIIAGPTGHGKTLVLINMILNYLALHPDKSVFFFSYEESRAAILSLFLNTYINENISSNNRSSIKSYFHGDINYILHENRELFLKMKDQFFKSLIDSGRLNIFYTDYYTEELIGASHFLKKNSEVGMVGVDYTQLLNLKNKQTTQRQEELKQICLILKDCAVDTGLPILLAAQFNRTVVNEATMNKMAIGEAGDVERSANTIIGLWNRNENESSEVANKGRRQKTISKESAIYMELLKSREEGTGHASVFDLNGNTGKLSPRTETATGHTTTNPPPVIDKSSYEDAYK